MIKPSEFTEATSELMKQLFAKYYTAEEVVVVTGGPDIGAEFTKLPFDHILFTGATSVAHHVMRAAADNLVPLTLELGGKSPVILGKSADLKVAAARVMNGKTLMRARSAWLPTTSWHRRTRWRALSPLPAPPSPQCSRRSRTTLTTPRSSPSGTMTGLPATSTTPGPRAPG
jgi:hypothetical protein